MVSSLSNLVDNLIQVICKIKCKYGHVNKKCGKCGIKYKDCHCCIEYTNGKGDLMECKCLLSIRITKKCLMKRYKICQYILIFSHSLNNFVLLLRKGVYPYEYMDDWEKSVKHHYQRKSYFDSYLNMEDIAEIDYMHTKRVLKDFEIKNIGEYRHMHV